jgi:hypothetical protein
MIDHLSFKDKVTNEDPEDDHHSHKIQARLIRSDSISHLTDGHQDANGSMFLKDAESEDRMFGFSDHHLNVIICRVRPRSVERCVERSKSSIIHLNTVMLAWVIFEPEVAGTGRNVVLKSSDDVLDPLGSATLCCAATFFSLCSAWRQRPGPWASSGSSFD